VRSHRFLVLFLVGAALAATAAVGRDDQASAVLAARAASVASPLEGAHWIAGWSASPEAATKQIGFPRGFADQTVRNVVFASVGGSMARVTFTNTFGKRPLEIGGASIGRVLRGAQLEPASDAPLAFSGSRSVVIPPGGSVVSDPVPFPVRALEPLAVSVFLPDRTGAPTDHRIAREINFVALDNQVLKTGATAFTRTTTSWYYVSGLEVLSSPRELGTVVAFGDSITDGAHSRIDANLRWPNDLARRFDAIPGQTLSVVDAGLSGNRLLGRSHCCGPSGLSRFNRDVASQPGAREVIVLEGVNDIGYANASADQIIAGYRDLIRRAHALGLKIFGGTITPFEGAGYWSPAKEITREAVNAWILHSHAFDGAIDFASVVADPANPQRLRPAYDSSDHLHPNSAGYHAMAQAANLATLLSAAHS
jgi:lysophospholipase L1-like esterase